MKKLKTIFLLFFIVTVCVSCVSIPASNVKSEDISYSFTAEKISQNIGNIEVSFDPRTELVMIIARLAGYPEYNFANGATFLNAVDEWFAPYKKHNAVKTFKNLRSNHAIAYDAIPSFAVHLKNDFSGLLYEDNGIYERLDTRWPKNQIPGILKDILKFRNDSNFDAFFESMKSEYEKSINDAISYMEKGKVESWLSSFYGKPDNLELHFVLSFISGNYGSSIRQEDGSLLLTPVVINYYSLDVIIHEFSHGVCNPLVEKNWDELRDVAENLYNLHPTTFNKNAYYGGRTIMYETIVRTCTGVYVLETSTEQDFQNYLRGQDSQGFTFIEPLSRKTLELHKQGMKFDELFPLLVEYINQTL